MSRDWGCLSAVLKLGSAICFRSIFVIFVEILFTASDKSNALTKRYFNLVSEAGAGLF